ncbi:MAG: 50S ribosomal protein L23 [Armatimonadetes bacterium]|nr:50S ribosomal protein L23 [Armatimonadota bacterium]PIU65723.1 MAG: 50S ribosomal protein L23 [Armatimonadetes bacterium CG07_land_8_20_14_0_80_59_28]PIX38266.1 MAG: 50S ribosomal protein L23 [Armatimonadetes bacterium CG_4_8_14_3_um_filter_58_9]PIY45095.1 MAG: 50S ribosomal protein L23 [Armatimonadetes bacterium CG_4_10_14_3_um_filter_59_10]PJB64803.1 MAG: 50S ribosomal protein L23 [Armatimonadetes bacterium CG_4_9_14_3_um_filter_58_7]
MDIHVLIERPMITEKSVIGARKGKYTFKVHPDANKIEIHKAIEEKFKVKVLKVNTINVPGKKKRMGRFPEGRTASWKKAIVTLAPGQKIPLFAGM